MINIPIIQQIFSDVKADLESKMDSNIPIFGKAFLTALVAVQSAKFYIFYLILGRIEKNIFPDTADPESKGGSLERFGRVKLGRNPFPATQGVYSVQVYGTTGAVIKASTTFKSNDDALSPGKLFIIDSDYILDGTNVISLRALESGIGSKLNAGDQLTVTSPVALVESVCEVLSQTIEPRAAESIEDYRRKIRDAFRLEAQGGAGADYRLWASEVQGVQQSYPYAKSGVTSEINLYVESEIADSTDGKGTPSAQMLLDVEEIIEEPTTDRPARKPLTVIMNYLPVIPKDIDIEITGFVGITAEIETLIFNAIKNYLDDVRPFVSSIDVLSEKNDKIDNNTLISLILQARPGSVFDSLAFEVDGSAEVSFIFENGDIPYLNNITYI